MVSTGVRVVDLRNMGGGVTILCCLPRRVELVARLARLAKRWLHRPGLLRILLQATEQADALECSVAVVRNAAPIHS